MATNTAAELQRLWLGLLGALLTIHGAAQLPVSCAHVLETLRILLNILISRALRAPRHQLLQPQAGNC